MLSLQDLTSISIPVLQLALEAGAEIVEVYRSRDLQVERKADLSPLTLADRRAHDVIDAALPSIAPGVPVISEEGRDIPFKERQDWNEFWLVDPLDGTKEFIKGNGEFTVNIGLIRNGTPTFGVIYAPVCGVAYIGICPAPPEDTPAGEQPGDRQATQASRNHRFPEPGAYRIVIDHDLAGHAHSDSFQSNLADLDRRAEPINGARPRADHITMIGSRSHIGARTRAFMKRIGGGFDDVKLMQIGSSLKLCMIAEGSANVYPRFWPTMEWDTAAGHALIRAAGGEVWQAPRSGHKPVPDWLADSPEDPDAKHTDEPRLEPLPYNKKNLTNKPFVARGW